MPVSRMTTRRAAAVASAQEMERQLKLTLEELQCSKRECNMLLEERSQNEEELNAVLSTNSGLKREMAELHAHLTDVLTHRDQLLQIINKFDECSNTYEQALGRIDRLEVELLEANKHIEQLEQDRRNQEVTHTQSLFEELIGTPAQCTAAHSYQDVRSKTSVMSKNKLKKYVKISRFITKTKKLIKKQNCFISNIKLRKQRADLIDSIEIYSAKLKKSRLSHERDTEQLQADIQRLHQSLDDMTHKYTRAQILIDEHVKVTCQILSQQTSDADISTSQPEVGCLHHTSKLPVTDHPAEHVCKQLSQSGTISPCNQVIMLSDQMGVGYGPLLAKNLPYEVMNNCMPGATFKHIVSSIINMQEIRNKVVIIMLGDGLNITKSDIIHNFSVLRKLDLKKVILCAIPFSSSYTTEQNNSIHILNTLLFNLTCRHSDKFVFFDTNKFINNKFVVTGKFFYLPIILKREVASLLAYNIKDIVNKIDKTLEHVPNNIFLL